MGIILRDSLEFGKLEPMDIDKYYEGLLFKQDGKIAEALEAFEESAGDDPANAPA